MQLDIYVIAEEGADRPYVSTSQPTKEYLAMNPRARMFIVSANLPIEKDERGVRISLSPERIQEIVKAAPQVAIRVSQGEVEQVTLEFKHPLMADFPPMFLKPERAREMARGLVSAADFIERNEAARGALQ